MNPTRVRQLVVAALIVGSVVVAAPAVAVEPDLNPWPEDATTDVTVDYTADCAHGYRYRVTVDFPTDLITDWSPTIRPLTPTEAAVLRCVGQSFDPILPANVEHQFAADARAHGANLEGYVGGLVADIQKATTAYGEAAARADAAEKRATSLEARNVRLKGRLDAVRARLANLRASLGR